MKFPSLSRMPRHKRFSFEPRYYDPVKEDVKNRTERLKVESRLAERQAYTEHIKAAYSSRIRKRNTTNMMQLVLIAIILGTVIGWLMYGNNVLYYSAGMLALYIFIRTRRFFR
jgi:hypothetical protein